MDLRGNRRRDRSGWGVAGTIEHASSQNWVSVFGKRFAIDRIGVVLDGGVQVNPQLDIAAHHDSPSVGRLTIGVRGHLQHPVLEFGSVNYPAASQAEVLAMIILGRRDTRGSSSQSGDLASQASSLVVELVRDLAVGTATANLQQRYSFLPTLIVEPGERQQYGAGVSLGPRFYLQATYGTASNSTGTTGATSAQQLRVLLEIAMSSVWSTAVFGTVGTSGQQPGTTGGGVDVFWSP
jgi:autotransporter translocation and assembly factor TamB